MSTGVEFWNQKYGQGGFVYGQHPNRFLVEQAPQVIPPFGKVLSLGEGEGRNAVWLASQGWEVTAVDYSQPALDKLQDLAGYRGVEVKTHCADVLAFDCGIARWDAVVLLHMHLPPDKRRTLHRQVVKELRPGGALILEALRLDQIEQPTSKPETPELFYRAQDLRDDFEELTLCLLGEEDRHIEAGEHRGMTSVIHMIARKYWP